MGFLNKLIQIDKRLAASFVVVVILAAAGFIPVRFCYMSDTTFSARASAMQIPSLPPGVKLTTLDNGLVIIVRGSPFYGTVASRKRRVKIAL